MTAGLRHRKGNGETTLVEQGGGGAGGIVAKKSTLVKVKDDLQVLKSIWFKPIKKSGSHAERLDAFYAPQAKQYDQFRKGFLWGREPLLRSLAARLKGKTDLTWVDLGGGTAENVAMMSKYMPLDNFKQIYVVDLCSSLCRVAENKAREKGWDNVSIVEGDACTFSPKESGSITVVTFSYSLSMIPPFLSAVDNAINMLDDKVGLFGIADFYVSSKFDLPLRQHPWSRRFFWRSIFDIDNIDLGPERRQYIEHKLERICEFNSSGGIPYVPYLRAPYYVWIGRKGKPEDSLRGTLEGEEKVERPPMFPPTFLYNMSWEDPRPDEKVLKTTKGDVVLTLTSGGDNTLDLAIQGADEVHSVDMNPAQSYLLELKKTCIQHLDYDDVWQLFGAGHHYSARSLLENDVGPFMSQGAQHFWYKHIYYFADSLYYHGAMGKIIWWVGFLLKYIGMQTWVDKIANAETLEKQVEVWDSAWFVKFFKLIPYQILRILTRIIFNPALLWWGMGVPTNQWRLIKRDDRSMIDYAHATLDGIAYHTHLRTENYFYLACLTGSYTKTCCPAFLTQKGFQKLKEEGAVNNVKVHTTSFMEQLTARMYTKVILMDHVDWLDEKSLETYARALAKHVKPGGRVIWRSASLNPPYVHFFEEAGFTVTCVDRHCEGKTPVLIDMVNMYASFWVAERKGGNGAAKAA